MVFYTVMKLTKTSLLGAKKWIGCVHFVCGPKVCIVSLMARTGALNATPHGFLHSNETDQNITIGSKKVDWVRSFRFWTESVHRFVTARTNALNATPAWFFAQ